MKNSGFAQYKLLYMLLTPVIILPVIAIALVVTRGDESNQLYNQGLIAASAGDYKYAAECFERSGALGNGNSYYNLALIYKSGALNVKDEAELVLVNLMRASLYGSIPARFELGQMYELPPHEDHAQAALFYRSAALGGHSGAQLALGRLYENGQGVEKSELLAEEFYMHAIRQNNAEARVALAMLYISRGRENDYENAAKLLAVAIRDNYPKAFTAMGYLCGKRAPESEDARIQSGRYYRRAAELADPEGLINYGDWLMNSARESEALTYYRQAAEKFNFSPALHRLGLYYFKQTPPDYNKARDFFERAAALGNGASWINLGIMAELGQGSAIDLDRARECYNMAEKLGHRDAAKRLKAL